MTPRTQPPQPPRLALALALAACLLAPIANAAPQGGGRAQAIFGSEPLPGRLIDVDFPGGTVADYYAALRAGYADANLVVPQEADFVPLPALRLSGVTLSSAIRLPGDVSGHVRVETNGGDGVLQDNGQVRMARAYHVVLVDPSVAARRSADATLDLDFAGGSAAAYINAVQLAAGASRVVAMPGVEAFQMPAAKLTGVSLESAIEVLTSAERMDQAGAAQRLAVEPKGDGVIVVKVLSSGRGGPISRSTALTTEVWSLAEMLGGSSFTADDVLTAVETALRLHGGAEPNMRYHAETKLLIVRGDDAEVATVHEVLGGLRDSSSTISSSEAKKAELVYELRAAELNLAHMQARAAAAEDQLAKAEAMAETGRISDQEIAQGRMGVERARGEVDLATLRVEQARLRLESFGDAAPKIQPRSIQRRSPNRAAPARGGRGTR